MRPSVAAGLLSAVCAVAAFGSGRLRPSLVTAPPAPSAAASAKALCPAGTLPDDGVCIPVPPPAPAEAADRDTVPLRPDRPADFAAYALPVGGAHAAPARPGSGRTSDALALTGAPGTPVVAVGLEGQEGPATVVYQGPLVGATVVLRHAVRESGTLHDYLTVTGEVREPVSLSRDAAVPAGAALGRTGETPVHFQTRLMRGGADPMALEPGELLGASSSVPVDARNVLRRK